MTQNITSKTGRNALKQRREPYWSRITVGLFVGYRKLREGEGTWITRKRDDDGKQRYQAIGAFPDYDEAVKAAQAWSKQHELGIDAQGTVEEACRAYVKYLEQHKSIKASQDAGGRFNRLVYGKPCGRIKLDKLRTTQVRDWLNRLIPVDAGIEATRRAKDTANRNLKTLKAALNRALKDRLIDSDAGWRTVSAFPAVGKRRERLLTLDERSAILKNCPQELSDLVTGMLLTFARPGELASAKVSDFDPKHGTLSLSGKTGARTVTLSTAAVQFFKTKYKGKLPAAPLLACADGKPWVKERWGKPYKQAALAAGLPGEIVLYHIRHAAISEAIAGGIDSFLVAKLAGTSTAMIDKHYGHLKHEVTRARLDAVRVL